MLRTTSLLLLVAALAYSAPVDTENAPSLWSLYKQTYGKTYNLNEDSERLALFNERVQFVQEHNERFHKGLETFTVELNDRADLTVTEMMQRNGYQQQQNRTGDSVEFVAFGALPTSVDWRTKGYVTPVKDQGQCGSCWSFGTTGAVEGQWFHKTGKLVSLSEQNLIDCDTQQDHGCNGGLPSHAYEYIKAHGIDTESSYPYTGKQGSCHFNAAHVGAKITGFKSIARGSESALQTASATVGPISVGIDASHISFQLYKTGIYNEPKCSTSALDHAVLVVGYGVSGGQDYWLVKNSWNANWGEKGYIMMSRNKSNQCGIATDATYPTV